jgi:four helix bundle protein
MNEIAEQLKERTMRFAVRVMRFSRTLPPNWDADFVRDQLFRAATRTAANYHAACRARSHRDFVSKIGVVVEESDESVFWLTFLRRAELATAKEGLDLLAESRELLAIFIQSAKTASSNRR